MTQKQEKKEYECVCERCGVKYAEYVNGCPRCATGEVGGSASVRCGLVQAMVQDNKNCGNCHKDHKGKTCCPDLPKGFCKENKEWADRFDEKFMVLNSGALFLREQVGVEGVIKPKENIEHLKFFISQEILRVREEAYEDGRNEKAPMGVSQWKNHGDKYEYAKFWEKKIRNEERERIMGIVDSVFEKGHGGGNWRRLVLDLKNKICES